MLNVHNKSQDTQDPPKETGASWSDIQRHPIRTRARPPAGDCAAQPPWNNNKKGLQQQGQLSSYFYTEDELSDWQDHDTMNPEANLLNTRNNNKEEFFKSTKHDDCAHSRTPIMDRVGIITQTSIIAAASGGSTTTKKPPQQIGHILHAA
eukprot:jgi/Psemu1/49071/gm1.49071_g